MQPGSGSHRRKFCAVNLCALVIAGGGTAVTAWHISHHHAALQRASCGSALTHLLSRDTQFLSAEPGSLACFVQAARNCRSASIAITEMGVDSGTDYVFILTPAKPSCAVTEQSQDYSANFGGSRSAVSTVPCRRIAVTLGGVTLSCRGQTVLLPARVS